MSEIKVGMVLERVLQGVEGCRFGKVTVTSLSIIGKNAEIPPPLPLEYSKSGLV